MRKFLLLFTVFMFLSSAQGQDTVYYETFDGPAAPNVTTGSIGPGTAAWNDTNFLSISPSMSFHVQGKQAGQTVYFETAPFSTVNNPYVFLSFWQIAKLWPANKARIKFSTDGGLNFDTIPTSAYMGASPNFGPSTASKIPYFNSSSYGPLWGPTFPQAFINPSASWWRKENFDLSGVVSNLTTGTGFPDVRIRFEVEFGFAVSGTPDFSPGWFIDNVLITRAACELNPPVVNMDFAACALGYKNKPTGGLVANPSGNYDVGLQADDNTKSYDTGIDSVAVFYSVKAAGNPGFGPWLGKKLPKVPTKVNEYRGTIDNLGIGDTVRWYTKTYDLACPNITRVPDTSFNNYAGFYVFWIDSAPPVKCGTPFCNAYPFIVQNLPWTEDFESSDWSTTPAPGGDIPGAHELEWNRFPNPSTNNPYGWTVATGQTPTQYTGPNADHTTGTGGKYLYAESDGTGNPALLITPCLDLTNSPSCLAFEFYYHMFGDDIGELHIEIDTGANTSATTFVYESVLGEQQSASTDPWKRAVFSLEPFIGKIIKVTFRAKRTLSGNRNDIAIDDLRIFDPSSVDVVTVSNDAPVNGYCDYSSQDVKITVLNNGCNMLNTIPVAYQPYHNSVPGAIVWDTIKNAALPLGDTMTYTFSTPVSLVVSPNLHQIKVWASVSGDVNLNNDTATGETIQSLQGINTFPFFEDFESATIGTQNLGNSNFHFDPGLNPAYKWLVGHEMTATRNTGPYSGFYYEGNYLYTEGDGSSGVVSTFLRTLCLDFSSPSMTHPVLDFYYHAYGSDIQKLEVQVSEGNQDLDTWTTVSTINAIGAQNSERDRWEFERVDLSAYAAQSIKLRFKATRTGSGNRADLAIDEISVYNAAPSDGGGLHIDNPANRSVGVGIGSADVTIVNYGTTTLQTCTINFKLTPYCGPNQGISTVFTQYVTSANIAPGDVKQFSLASAGITWPVGDFEACVYITSPNGVTDPHSFNDTICRDIIGGNQVYEIPFHETFDPCDHDATGFVPQKGFLQWEYGQPNSGMITDDSSPNGNGNAWVTNIDGDFIVDSPEDLKAPIFDGFDTIYKAELRFYQNIDFGPNTPSGTSYDIAGTLKYFSGGYEVLGANFLGANLGINWFGNPTYGASVVDLMGGDPAWVGSTNGSWIYTMFPLDEFNASPLSQLILRFEFRSSANLSQSQATGGWGIDDFEVYIPPQNSARPINVNTVSPLPLPGFDQDLNVTIQNTGGKMLDTVLVEIEVDGVMLGTHPDTLTFLTPLSRGQSETQTYKFKWPGNLVTSGAHQICVYTSRPNNVPDDLPVDDDSCFTRSVLLELDFSEGAEEEYCEDFENPANYQWITLNSDNLFLPSSYSSWEMGDPVQAGGAYSGANAWMTGLTTNYTSLDASSLFTPVFEVDSGVSYQIEFHHWLRSEKYHDGGNVEYSFDGGITWFPLGYKLKDSVFGPTWYNTEFVTALNQTRGGWTDSTAGWENARIAFSFLNDVKVIFRFRFGADYDIEDRGWAIDNFCFTKRDTADTSAIHQMVIGLEEMLVSEDVVIGLPAPNPSTELSQLAFSFPNKRELNVRVYNVVGQLIESRNDIYPKGVHTLNFNTSGWSNGIYFINLEYDGNRVTRKLIVAH